MVCAPAHFFETLHSSTHLLQTLPCLRSLFASADADAGADADLGSTTSALCASNASCPAPPSPVVTCHSEVTPLERACTCVGTSEQNLWAGE